MDNIQHVESTSYNGFSVIRVFLQPGASLDTANAQVTAASQYELRQLPPGILPPQIINFSASSVPILQIGVSGEGMSEAQLNDYATNFVRTQLVTVRVRLFRCPTAASNVRFPFQWTRQRCRQKESHRAIC